ncbi:MAG: molybdenum cofactor guanylyltransferase [Proteobacteria bacterium]|nr:molybdenum cofactor guanylyltransferase [Pseudomonadota bacterium]
MTILGAIIAGGRSARMGREKAGVLLDGKPLLAHVMARLSPQVDAVIINANGPRFRFAGYGCPVIPDLLPDIATPLAGLHAVLRYARDKGHDAVVTVPSDGPFLPTDLVRRLQEARGQNDTAAIAMSGGQRHHLTGLWPALCYELLDEQLTQHGLKRVQDFARLAQAASVEWPSQPFDPFFNINTPDDLTTAAQFLLQ